MTDNIKRLFEQMNEPTKEEAITCIKKEFNVTNRSWITNEWLMGGRIQFYLKNFIAAALRLTERLASNYKF